MEDDKNAVLLALHVSTRSLSQSAKFDSGNALAKLGLVGLVNSHWTLIPRHEFAAVFGSPERAHPPCVAVVHAARSYHCMPDMGWLKIGHPLIHWIMIVFPIEIGIYG